MGRRLRLQQQEKEWEKVQQRQQLARSPVAPHSASAQMFKHCVPHTYTHTYTQSVCVCVCVFSGSLGAKQTESEAKPIRKTKPNPWHTHTALYPSLHTLHYTAHGALHTLPNPPPPALFAHCMREGAFCLKFVFEWKTFVKINYEFVRSIVFR